MRIGMLADMYKPHVSGVTNYISLNKRVLEAAGHEVFVFTFGEDAPGEGETNVIRSPGLPLLDTGIYLNLRYSTAARKLLRTMDIAHVHHPFLSGTLALRYCRPHNIPIVFTNHTRYDLYAQAYLPGMPGEISETAMQAFFPAFCRSCELVIAPSAGMKTVLQRFGVDSLIQVVPNGVDLRPFQPPLRPVERKSIGLDGEDVVLIYLGRLGPEKNLPFLLRAFRGVFQAFQNARLVLVGDGPERVNLEDEARHLDILSAVRFTGMVDYSHVPQYLAMADIFVTASVTEVHPLSVIEAMAAGLPVLGIQSPGVGDIVQDGISGLLAASQDQASFAAKMAYLVMDQSIRRKLGKGAFFASGSYSIEKTCQIMVGLYQKAVERASQREKGFRARLDDWLDHWLERLEE